MYQEEFVIHWENIPQLKLHQYVRTYLYTKFNPLNAKLNPICHLLALLAHHILHISRIRVNVYRDHYAKSFKEKRAFIHLEITKYILK